MYFILIVCTFTLTVLFLHTYSLIVVHVSHMHVVFSVIGRDEFLFLPKMPNMHPFTIETSTSKVSSRNKATVFLE